RHEPRDQTLPARVDGLRERVLRLDLRVSKVLIELMRLGPGVRRPEPHEAAADCPRPRLSVIEQHPTDAASTMLAIDDETFDQYARRGIDMLGHGRVDPTDALTLCFGNHEPMVASRQNARQP